MSESGMSKGGTSDVRTGDGISEQTCAIRLRISIHSAVIESRAGILPPGYDLPPEAHPTWAPWYWTRHEFSCHGCIRELTGSDSCLVNPLAD